jgi:hypothetical protein
MWVDHQIKDLVDHWSIIVWMQLLDLEIIKWLEGFADDIALYYLVMDGVMVLDDLVHLLWWMIFAYQTYFSHLSLFSSYKSG